MFIQKQPSRGVLRKRYPENMQQMYRRTCKATLLKPHFDMGIVLQICCIFSEYLFLGIPTGGCFFHSSGRVENVALCKKSSFPFKISSVNMTKSERYCGFGHIY